MRPSGANALRYSPSSLAPYSIASGPYYEHRNSTSRHVLSYTSAPDADARLHAYPLPRRSIPPASSLSHRPPLTPVLDIAPFQSEQS